MGWMDGLSLGASTDSLSQKAAQCFQYGKFKDAIKYLDRLIAVEPEESRWLDLKGCCLTKLGKYKEAHTCLEKATRLSPNNAEAWASRGSVLLKMGKWAAAVDCFGKALKVSSKMPELTRAWIYHSLAEGLFELNRFEEALANFDKALELKVKAETLVGKGQCLHSLGRYDQAVQSYGEALSHSPGHAEAHLYKACSHDKQGQIAEVVTHLEQFLSFASPDDRRVEIANARIRELANVNEHSSTSGT